MSVEPLGGGTFLAEIHMAGQGASSGATVEDHFATLVVFRHGEVVRVDSYDDRAAALADIADD